MGVNWNGMQVIYACLVRLRRHFGIEKALKRHGKWDQHRKQMCFQLDAQIPPF